MRNRSRVSLRDIELVSREDAFLIADLISDRITVISGEPKAGKSLFVAGAIIALCESHPTFVGMGVNRQIDSIVYAYADEGGEAELRARLDQTAALDIVELIPMDLANDADWDAVVADVIDDPPGLFVLDTAINSLPLERDPADPSTNQWLVTHLSRISDAGIPVIVVTHTAKGSGEGFSVASSPMGGRALAAKARSVLALRNEAKGTRRLQALSNRGSERVDLRLSLSFAEGSEVPLWTAECAAQSNARPDRRSHFVQRVLAEQPDVSSVLRLAQVYASHYGKGISTMRKWAEDLHHDGSRWVRAEEAQAA